MKARIVWIALGLGLVVLVAMRVSAAKKAASAPQEKAPDAALVRTTHVSRVDLDEKVAFTGNVRAKNEVDVFPKLGGRVDTVLVQVGDRVRAGQVLATVEHKEIGWQAKQAQASVQAAMAGSKAAEAQVKVAEAQYEGAKLDYDRTLELAKGGSAPQAQVDGAKIKLELVEAQLAAAKAQVLGSQAQIAQAQAASGLAEQQVDNSRIESPINGVVTKKNLNVGVQVGPQQPAFSVQDVATLKLESSVDAVQFAQLQKGSPAVISVDAFPGEEFRGKVDVLSPALDPQTRRAAVEIAIDNANGRLLPHLFAKADVTVGKLEKTLAVPKEAVLEAPGGSVVFRVKNGAVEAVRPKFGPSDGHLVSVLEGLNEGDELALTGLGNLSDGAAVKVAPAVSENERR